MKINGQYVICRTKDAGVFAGNLKSKSEKEVVLENARRIWYWEGAASLSELAVRGVKTPDKCKFPCPVPKILLTECIEIIPCTEEAKKNIMKVEEWTAH